jgi:hypothetical protein
MLESDLQKRMTPQAWRCQKSDDAALESISCWKLLDPEVRKFNTGGSVGGGVISYAIGDKQYVATTSGVVSGFFGGTGNATIVVFSLP